MTGMDQILRDLLGQDPIDVEHDTGAHDLFPTVCCPRCPK